MFPTLPESPLTALRVAFADDGIANTKAANRQHGYLPVSPSVEQYGLA